MCRLNLAIYFLKMTSDHIGLSQKCKGGITRSTSINIDGEKQTSLSCIINFCLFIISIIQTHSLSHLKYSPPSHYLTYQKHLTQLIALSV